MGKKAQIVSYWYRPFFQLALHEGPFDALLRIRGGDVDAWTGRLTASGSINVSEPNLWGGEESEGGIQGTFDVMFGELDASPNAFIQGVMGADPSNHNGVALLQFNSGRYGAGNPYPKPVAALTERIYAGWLDDACWYPETAAIPIGGDVTTGVNVAHTGLFSGGGEGYSENTQDLEDLELQSQPLGRRFHAVVVVSTDNCPRRFIARQNSTNEVIYDSGWIGDVALQSSLNAILTAAGKSDLIGPVWDGNGRTDLVELDEPAGWLTVRTMLVRTDGAGGGANVNAGLELWTVSVDSRMWSMNPAHVVYDTLTYLQGEPVASIDEASFTAAADQLYAEDFGICTKYDHSRETIEQFRQRILALIGADCSRYNGKWYLDLIRPLSSGEISALPVLEDDDILEWQEDPSTRDDAVNQVAVRWFDPDTKQSRITPHVHALAAINDFGTINGEVSEYPEVPVEELANRLALRDLRNKCTPTRRFNLTTNRRPYSWRKGRAFRMQCPKRGIADMVCRVVDIDRGTLQSGAIRLVAVQDVFAMPDTAYIVGEPPLPPSDQEPVQIEHALAFEAPYLEVSRGLPAAELSALAEDAGFVQAVAARPANGVGYSISTSASGADFEVVGNGDWCPTATVVESSGLEDEAFTLADGALLDRVQVGSLALWGDELVRVKAIDAGTGAVQFGRACGDTVPHLHDAGERVWFLGDSAAVDPTEYTDSEEVRVRFLNRTGSRRAPLWSAPEVTVELASRAARPYPPARPRIDDSATPTSVSGSFVVSWRHRDRLLQADQVVDQQAASVGPEPTCRYALRLLDEDGLLLVEKLDIAGDTATVDLDYTGDVTLELYSINDAGESWQRHVRAFAYAAGSATEHTIVADTYEPPYTIIDGGEIT